MSKYSKKQRDQRDRNVENYGLWNLVNPEDLTSEQIAFLSQCMTENLEHARHVENERLTFNSIFLALIAGALAFANAFSSAVAFGLYTALTMAGFLSIVLTTRWNNAFDRHLFYAQKCYTMIHSSLFGSGNAEETRLIPEAVPGLGTLPMYCFKIHKPIARCSMENMLFKVRTNKLYISFYLLIQLLLIACTVSAFVKVVG